jgi:UDP-galactopyranose mutase
MALAFTDRLSPVAVVYDCMDELSAFKGAPAMITERETELMSRAALVLTGGKSLFEAKRHQHANIHLFPSSVDVAHFAQARRATIDPPDQADIPHPRLGFFGVIDERMDMTLLEGVAAARPDWHLVMVGPIVKIDPAALPRRANIHYLGSKRYEELPEYVAGWDVALLPFARNDATRFISPTKTPEYLAAGKPVVSTSIRDVVRPYGTKHLARIADDTPTFVDACTAAMTEDAAKRIARADAFLRQMSWDRTWTRIRALLDEVIDGRRGGPAPAEDVTAA